jgi:hypothetical protein
MEREAPNKEKCINIENTYKGRRKQNMQRHKARTK